VLVVLATVAGFGLLEVVLLAGAAFAVGARRQSRELGLLAAGGGDVSDVRRVVLVQGILLGVAGALVGAAAGVLGVALFKSRMEEAAGRVFGSVDPHALDLLAVMLIGLVAALVAAVAPARGAARRPVLEMLASRFPSDDVVARNPRWANVALIAGPLVTLIAALVWHTTIGKVSSSYVSIDSLGDVPSALSRAVRDDGWAAVIFLGAAITLAGLVRSCPVLLSRLGRFAGRLPLRGRLALRDAARHRHRTAPATAAVMTVLAGAVLVLFVVSSTDLRNRDVYSPVVPVGSIDLTIANSDSAAADTATALRTLATATGGGVATQVSVATPPRGRLVADSGCADPGEFGGACPRVAIGVVDQAGLDLLTGGPDAAARKVYAAGGAVLLSDNAETRTRVDVLRPGHDVEVTLPGGTPDDDVPAYTGLPTVLISPQTAEANGWGLTPFTTVFTPRSVPTDEEVDRIRSQLPNLVGLYIERGYDSRYSIALLAILMATGIATLAGTSVAVALAMAESKADMGTLAAVGASPARKRLHAMGQAGTVAGLGTVHGLGRALFVALCTLAGSTFYPTSTPYRWLALAVLGVPALAVLIAGVFTRSKVTMTRRLT
jgi:putative ABC transport system permease protein